MRVSQNWGDGGGYLFGGTFNKDYGILGPIVGSTIRGHLNGLQSSCNSRRKTSILDGVLLSQYGTRKSRAWQAQNCCARESLS